MLHSLNDSAIRSANVIYDLVVKWGSKSLFSLGKVTYTLQVLSLFDNYLSQGLAPREAIKRTRKALEDMEHPWGSYDAVFRVVSGSGALRGKGFYKGWYARYRKK